MELETQTIEGAEVVTRSHPRVGADFVVKLKAGQKVMWAQATDLSMEGLCLVGDFDDVGEEIVVGLSLPMDRQVVTKAKVVRRDEGKVGVQFEKLDWDDMFALARYLNPRLP